MALMAAPAPLAPLHAVVEANRRGAGRGIFTRQIDDVLAGNPGQRFGPLRRILGRARPQFGESIGVAFHVIGVVQILADDHVHHP